MSIIHNIYIDIDCECYGVSTTNTYQPGIPDNVNISQYSHSKHSTSGKSGGTLPNLAPLLNHCTVYTQQLVANGWKKTIDNLIIVSHCTLGDNVNTTIMSRARPLCTLTSHFSDSWADGWWFKGIPLWEQLVGSLLHNQWVYRSVPSYYYVDTLPIFLCQFCQ